VDIWSAIEKEDLVAIRKYAEAKGDLEYGATLYGKTPLLHALRLQKRESYQLLLELGASPNTICHGGAVVMNIAAREEDSWWLEQALNAGGDPNIVNEGASKLKEGSPLAFAIEVDRLENVKLLCAAGADMNVQNYRNETHLTSACLKTNYDIVQFLLEQGADYLAPGPRESTFIQILLNQKSLPKGWLGKKEQQFEAVQAWLRADGFDIDKAEWDGTNWRIPLTR
jgi:ankyrin repeat protein